MPLTPGTRLGPYQITSALGAGGMGEVYLALDTRLERSVALKILPGHLSTDPDRRARFDREARVISSLNHPNICTLYDVGQENGVDFLVMEHLEGETLADRLARERMGMDQVLKIGAEIAAALDKAHRSGVVHRDLKPGNVMLTKTGAKLLDFGLAKIAGGDPAEAAMSGLTGMRTAAQTEKPLTEQGTILGTYQYMAPEQLEGQEADARTDLFALGALLYEMATGRKAFEGKSQASLIGAIMHSEPPPISSLEPLNPPALERLIKACLTKDPEERLQTAHDVLLQLRWIAEGGSQAGVPAPVSHRRRTRERTAWAVVAALAVACVALAAMLLLRPAPDRMTKRFRIAAPSGVTVIDGVQLSPDGKNLAFSAVDSTGRAMLWLQPLSSLDAAPIAGTDGAGRPWWSPDSRHLAYIAQSKLRKVAVAGGPPQTICDAGSGYDGAWGKDAMLFDGGPSDPLRRVAAAGGVAGAAVTRDSLAVGWPSFLPDGEHFLYVVIGGENHLMVGSLDGKPAVPLGVTRASRAQYAPPGYLLFVRDRTLLAQPFDATKRKLRGEPVPVAEDVWSASNGAAQFSASNDGTLIYRTGGGYRCQVVWVDREGRDLEQVAPPSSYANPSLAPDGKRFVIRDSDVESGDRDLWVIDPARGTKTRLTFGVPAVTSCIWSPDGQSIYYSSNEKGGVQNVFRKAASGAGTSEVVYESPDDDYILDLSRDGKYVAIVKFGREGLADIIVVSLADGEVIPVVTSPAFEGFARFSPDGHWIAYSSNESGRNEVYVQSFRGPPGKWQVSNAGGDEPAWRADGRELYYLGADQKITAVDVVVGDTFTAGVPRALFGATLTESGYWQYLASADGKRFLLLRPESAEAISPTMILLDWTASLRTN